MTTPYGTTSFYQYVAGQDNGDDANGLRVTLPDGTRAVIESWIGERKSTYFWDSEAMEQYPLDPAKHDFSHCRTTSYLFDFSTATEYPVVSTEKQALESATVYTYPDQSLDNLGSSSLPSQVTRPCGTVAHASVGGSATAGDTLSVIVDDATFGTKTVTYTVQSGDDNEKIAAGLRDAINADSVLQAIGAIAGSLDGTVILTSHSQNSTDFSGSLSFGATETLALTSATTQLAQFEIDGTVTAGDVVTFSSSGTTAHYTVLSGDSLDDIAAGLAAAINASSPLQVLGTSAVASGAELLVSCTSAVIQTQTAFANGGATETVTLEFARNGASKTSSFEYNSIGQLVKSVDPVGRVTTSSFDTNEIDLLEMQEAQNGDSFILGEWSYNSQHLPTSSIDGSGQETTTSYNSSGQPISITDPDSNTTTFTYTGTNTATISGTATSGNTLTLTVHDSGLSGGQKSVSYVVMSGDSLSDIATGLAAAVNADTDLQSIGVSASSAAAVVTLNSISINVTSYTESTSGGATETITLGTNVFGYLTAVDGPLSGSDDVTTMSYDSVGRLAQTTDSEGYTVAYEYDDADRLTKTTYPDGTTETTKYDRLNAVLNTDRIGRTDQRAYNALNQLVHEIDSAGRKTQYVWCSCGSLLTLTDANGNTTTWNHDLEGRTIAKVYPDQTKVSYSFDPSCGVLASRTDAMSQTTNYSYNPDSTMHAVSYQNAVNPTSTVLMLYDSKFSRLTSVQNDWGTISYTYNDYITDPMSPTTGGGMLTSVTNDVIPNSDITYSYDNLGRVTNRSIDGANNSIDWVYDEMSRIKSETNALGEFDYTYVDDVSGHSRGSSRLASIAYPNGQVTNFSWYDNNGDQRLQQILNQLSDNSVLSQFSYVYDPAGQIKQWQQYQNFNNQIYSLKYDKAGQLLSAESNYISVPPRYLDQYHYSYDKAANRTSAQHSHVFWGTAFGTVTAGDIVYVNIYDSGLSGGQET
ncbi:MAG TPA: hypothetical protein V6C72_12955, partial [Chroococcales cyanobacterium]